MVGRVHESESRKALSIVPGTRWVLSKCLLSLLDILPFESHAPLEAFHLLGTPAPLGLSYLQVPALPIISEFPLLEVEAVAGLQLLSPSQQLVSVVPCCWPPLCSPSHPHQVYPLPGLFR